MRRGVLIAALRGIDTGILALALGLAALIPHYRVGDIVTLSEFIHLRIALVDLAVFVVLIAIWQLCFQYFCLYHPTRLASLATSPLVIVKATAAGTACFAVGALISRQDVAALALLVPFWLLDTVLTIVVRLALRSLLNVVRRRDGGLRDLLIVGTNERGFLFGRRLQAQRDLGYRLVGFVDEPREIPEEFQAQGIRIVTDFDGLASYLASNVIDEVVLCLPVKSQYARAVGVIALCREQGILVRFLSDIFNTPQGPQAYAAHIGHDAVVTMSTGPAPGLSTFLKRTIDIGISLFLLTLLAPVAAAIILAIKLTSPGPAHFVQVRLGLHKRPFRIHKFRTMVAGAEAQRESLEEQNEVDGPVFKIKHDPRVTAVGRLLRKTSLDELPQLFNVLKGEMSLVGPRPLPVKDYNGFDEDWHRRRFSVQPGITCLWQVAGRNNLSFDRWMELDMEYIDRWSLGLDLRILFQTIPAVLRGSGAS
jgi:exopolysaccharide biosynthesis polyprenyl glycosylphosphotransferase